jgi:hypothetical protein
MGEQVLTFGDAAERSMVFRVECGCGRGEYFHSKDLARVWGKRRRIENHRFTCKKCKPPSVTVTPVPIDQDRLPNGRVMRLRAVGLYGEPEWVKERFSG